MTASLPTGQALRALGCWGPQGGLLSESELDALMACVRSRPHARVLEVGHFNGLSTLALLHALGNDGLLATIDHHGGDKWVPASPPSLFCKNLETHAPRMPAVTMFAPYDPTWLNGIRPDLVFWDADHGPAQVRAMVDCHRCASVRTVVFDDRDMPWANLGAGVLVAHGWRDVSPPFHRNLSVDKADPQTMTLGIFERPEAQCSAKP